MPAQTPPAPLEFYFDFDMKDALFAARVAYRQRRRGMPPRPVSGPAPARTRESVRVVVRFITGLCLGFLQVNLASVAILAAANVFGLIPQLAPGSFHALSTPTILVGLIWLYMLAGPSIRDLRLASACKRAWRIECPEILHGPVAVAVAVALTAERITFTMLGDQHSMSPGKTLRFVETDDDYIVQSGSILLPIAKSKLASDTRAALLGWASAHGIYLRVPAERPPRLPPRVSAWLGAGLCVFCLWLGTHIRTWPNAAIERTTVRLALPDATILVAGQTATLDHLGYSASDYQGALYDRMDGTVSRAELAGTFFIDRSGAPFLAQTAEAEFETERTWHLAVGQIPAEAAVDSLPESGAFIAWDNPASADYSGHCGALRANRGTTPLSAGRVLFRRRLYLQLCSSTMSKAELKSWMLEAIEPIDRAFALRTQTSL